MSDRLKLAREIAARTELRLFVQIELLPKPSDDFREPLLAGVIGLWDRADQHRIPGNTHRPGYRYPSAFALRMLAQFGRDHTFEFQRRTLVALAADGVTEFQELRRRALETLALTA